MKKGFSTQLTWASTLINIMCLELLPAHAALPGAGAAGGGRRRLVGPAVVWALQVPDHLQRHINHMVITWYRGVRCEWQCTFSLGKPILKFCQTLFMTTWNNSLWSHQRAFYFFQPNLIYEHHRSILHIFFWYLSVFALRNKCITWTLSLHSHIIMMLCYTEECLQLTGHAEASHIVLTNAALQRFS